MHNNLKIIYDASHAFGVNYRGRSLLSYGDAATISFHATKIFHTIEGGAIVFKRKEDLDKAESIINFGIDSSGGNLELGINAKMNEFQAAMGLSILDEINTVIDRRRIIWERYKKLLSGLVEFQEWISDNNNYGYFPVVFKNEEKLLSVTRSLNEMNIFSRRYFYPSLNNVDVLSVAEQKAKRAEVLAQKILCLPLYAGLRSDEQYRIIKCIKESV